MHHFKNKTDDKKITITYLLLIFHVTNNMITTYTHIPLVGVSTITDPKNDTITYTYDAFGRLEFVKDNKGNILSENQYKYKQ